MFLYLGEGKYKRLSDVIGIFDMDSATVCVATRRFLSVHERMGRVESDGELPKSFLLCEEERRTGAFTKKKRKRAVSEKKEDTVVLSKLASGVLFHRTASVREGSAEDEEQ